MNIVEVLIASQTPGVWDQINTLAGIEPIPAKRLSRALLEVERPDGPDAFYAEAACGTYDELVSLVRACMARNKAIFLGLQGANERYREEFESIGLAVTTMRDPIMITQWLAEQLGLRRRATAHGLVTLASGGVKGGIGKSTMLNLFADAYNERGVRSLMIDCDFTFSGIRRPYKIHPGAPSIMQILDDGHPFTPERLREYIYHHPCGIDFLLGSVSSANAAEDLDLAQWDAFMQAAAMLDEYTVRFVDTGPDAKARPYCVRMAREGGWVVIPAQAGCNESMSTANALESFETQADDLTSQCLILYQEPQPGNAWTLEEFAPQLEARFPHAKVLGTIPYDCRVITTAQKRTHYEGAYISPLEIAPHSRLVRTVHQVVDNLCQLTGVTPPKPMPKSSVVDRVMQWMGWFRPLTVSSTGSLSAPAVTSEEAAQ